MTLLHAHFNLRNQQAFQRFLDGGSDRGQSAGLGSSGGKRQSALTAAMSCDVNARDWLGRTVLHLACSSTERSGVEYVRRLLAHPAINVNIYDTESRWTPLHRALYHGNIATAMLLLQRSDVDTSLKDLEGYTAFDLYNSTVEGTKPTSTDDGSAEVYTWGANRNAALGLGDGHDRVYPDQVIIHQQEDLPNPEKRSLGARFLPIEIRQIAMSRLHTVLVTSESHGNIRVCGFGNGGRLGPGQHTQYRFKRLHQFTHTIISVALGQDHTLALTSSGVVLSWGLNRFSQLGYTVEVSPGVSLGRLGEPIQSTPRKIFGPLKKEIVRGVAACKTASACWTDRELYTFGTNNGQLGYDNPVQVVPRKVTKITQPAIAISICDSALVCLLETQEVVCIWKDRYFKIGFPSHAFPSEIQVYRPPQAVKDAHICKITNCDDTFAALSSNGEVFTFTVPNPSDSGDASGKDRAGIKPHCVWALRKQFSAVKDVALGSDGSIIICTESGHVFVRSRNVKTGQGNGGKAFRFQRVPFIQRVTSVCANNTGAFGVLRVDYKPKTISAHGRTMRQDLAGIQPYLPISNITDDLGEAESLNPNLLSLNEGADDPVIQTHVKNIDRLCNVLALDKARRELNRNDLLEDNPLPHGANLMVQAQSGAVFPVHSVILTARSSVIYDILSESKVVRVQDRDAKISLRLLRQTPALLLFSGCHDMTILILLTYLYSDELPAIWDRRVAMALEQQLRVYKVNPGQVKIELEILARLLDLQVFAQTLRSPVVREPPSLLVKDLGRMFHAAQTRHSATPSNISKGLGTFPLHPDVILQLADRDVFCHSVVLRARCVFFASFFEDPDWTAKRWQSDGTIHVNMKHLKWRAMQYVLRFLCCGEEEEMFDTLDFVNSLDEALEFMFEVMAAANELLLDRLVMICSVVILKFSNLANSCYILADATHFRCEPLMESLQGYMAVNMEVLIESRMLDDMAPDLIKQLSEFVRKKQAEKSPVSRSNRLVDAAMGKHADWLALQDIPHPIVRANRTGHQKQSPKLSPTVSSRKLAQRPSDISLSNSPSMRAQPSMPHLSHLDADIFAMDDPDGLPALNLDPPLTAVEIEAISKPMPVWRVSSVPRVDMKALMAEVASSSRDETTKPPPAVPTNQIADFASPSPLSPIKFSQRIGGRKEAWPTAEMPAQSSRSPACNWPQPSANSTSTLPSPLKSPDNARSASLTCGPTSKGGPAPSKSQPSPSTQPRPQASLGPVFTPSRQSSKSDTFRPSGHGGKAWTLPPVQPIVESSPSRSGVSFVAIQQLQLDQIADPGRDKRSLLQIQEEEQARQAEADFLKWWSAEEERIRAEEHALSRPRAGCGNRKSKKNGGLKGKGSQVSSSVRP